MVFGASEGCAVASIHIGKSKSNPFEVHWREQGRKRTKSFAVREEAEHKVREVEGRHASAAAELKRNLAFDQYGQVWLLYAERDLGRERTTLRRYQTELDYVILPWARRHRWTIANVSRQQVRALLTWRRKHVAKETAAKTAGTLFAMFRDAVELGFRFDDPTDGLAARTGGKAGKAPKRDRRVDPATLAEVEAVVEACAPQPKVQAWAATILYTGARPAEAISLRRQDVLRDRGQVKLAEDLYVDVAGKMWRKREPDEEPVGKSPAARRAVPLVDQLLPYLDAAEDWADDRQPDLVYPGRWTAHAREQDGAPMSLEHARRTMKRLCRAAGVRVLDPYDLRHFYAAALISTTENTESGHFRVKNVMGHEKVSTTLDLYGHLWEDDLTNLGLALSGRFGGGDTASDEPDAA